MLAYLASAGTDSPLTVGGMGSRNREREARRRKRGVTLVEVLITVAIIALISASVGLAVWKFFGPAQDKTAATNARTIREGVKAWWSLHDASECPSLQHSSCRARRCLTNAFGVIIGGPLCGCTAPPKTTDSSRSRLQRHHTTLRWVMAQPPAR